MHVVHVNLGFVEAASARALIERLPTASRLCEAIAAQEGTRVTHLARFWRNEDLVHNGVTYHLRADNPRQLVARHWTRPHAVYRLARALRPDVVQLYGAVFPFQTKALRRRIGSAPLVVQPHGVAIAHGVRRLVRRWGASAADAFFFTAAEQAEAWREAGLLDPSHQVFEVTDASTDFASRPIGEARAALRVSGAPLVLWVARLHPCKAPFIAVEGLARALDCLPDARAVIIGDGPLQPALEGWLRERPRVAARVALAGAVPHEALPPWYSAADVFLSSSPQEGSNWALIEALACGALPVCTDIPPHRRLTGGGRFGELWPVGDVARCAEAIVRAADRVVHGARETPDLRSRLRDHFDANLSWKAVARDSVAAYRTLLARRDRR